MFDFVEPRIRRVVAEHLGVDLQELRDEVSLTDDLAADSLDLVELTLGLEAELGITIPETAIDEMHTYGDLVRSVQALTRRRVEEPGATPTQIWARVLSPRGACDGELHRAGWLTPYTAETIAEDAVRAGRGARLEITVPASLGDPVLAQLQRDLAWLGDRGIEVSVRRQEGVPGRRPAAA